MHGLISTKKYADLPSRLGFIGARSDYEKLGQQSKYGAKLSMVADQVNLSSFTSKPAESEPDLAICFSTHPPGEF